MALKLPAFSLIEMAIVLIIMGVISSIALPALKGMLDWQKAATTAQRQEKILYALASYAIQNKALPYAGNPVILSGKQENLRRRGIVPYTDLGLPESFSKDGYNHWLTYVVDGNYAAFSSISHHIPNKLCAKQLLPTLLIKTPGVSNGIAVAIISHGPHGRGAYPNPLATPAQGRDEMQNSTSDMEIVDRPLSQDPLNPFSHKVIWATAQNLLAVYGHAPCPLKGGQKEMRYRPPSEGKTEMAPGPVFSTPPEINARPPYPTPATPKVPSGGISYAIPSRETKPRITPGRIPGDAQ